MTSRPPRPGRTPSRAAVVAVVVALLAVGALAVAPAPVAAATTVPPTVVDLPLVEARALAVDPGTGRVLVSGRTAAGADVVAVRGPGGAAAGQVAGLTGADTLVAAGGAVLVLRPSAAAVSRLDPVSLQVTGTWSLAPRTAPAGLAVAAGRVWTTARRPTGGWDLVAVDPATGTATPVAVSGSGGAVAVEPLGVLRAVPGAPTLLVGATTATPGRLRLLDVAATASGGAATVVVDVDADGRVADLAVAPDGTRVLVAAGEGGVEERSLPDLGDTGARYPTRWHERAVSTAGVGGPGSLVAVADLGLPADQDLWVHAEGDPTARRQGTVHTADREVVGGAMAFGPGGSRLHVVRQAQEAGSGLAAQLLVVDLGPTITGVAPRVVGPRGGGRVTVQGSGLGGATIRIGGKATSGVGGTGAARSVGVPSLPVGFASVEAGNDLGITAASPTPVVVRDLGPFADATAFTDRQVRDVLERGATAGEVVLADAALAGGGSLGALPVALVRSAPTSTGRAPVVRLYQAIFLRPPDTAGLDHWLGEQRRGRSLTQIATAMAAAPEFRTRYGALSDTAFVDRVYLNVLGRTADAAGRRYWVDALRSGQPRGKVVVGFSQSPEYVARLALQVDLTNLHVEMLGRAPTRAELTAALATASTGGAEAVAAGIVLSPAYRARVG